MTYDPIQAAARITLPSWDLRGKHRDLAKRRVDIVYVMIREFEFARDWADKVGADIGRDDWPSALLACGNVQNAVDSAVRKANVAASLGLWCLASEALFGTYSHALTQLNLAVSRNPPKGIARPMTKCRDRIAREFAKLCEDMTD